MFCGGGLFSYAARAAGMNVIFGVDNDSKALETYKANFPEAKVKCASVGPGADVGWENEVDIPGPAPNRHMHLSPPCTQISSANTACRDKEYGINALKWAIETGMKYQSWSVETVVSKSSHDVVKPLRDEHKTTGLLDFVELDAQMVGDPQTRKRLIIGPCGMINAIKTAPPCRIVSVKEAFERVNVQIPPGSTHTKNTSKCHSLSRKVVEIIGGTSSAADTNPRWLQREIGRMVAEEEAPKERPGSLRGTRPFASFASNCASSSACKRMGFSPPSFSTGCLLSWTRSK